MKITKLSIERVEGGVLVSTKAFFSGREEIEEGDIASVHNLMAEASATTENAEEKPKRKRRSSAQVAEDKAKDEDEKPKRRRRKSAEAETEEKVEDEKPKRRRRTAKGISDEDVSKAASEAAQELGPDLVAEILKEDHGVDELSELDQDSRKAFMATLVEEMGAE